MYIAQNILYYYLEQMCSYGPIANCFISCVSEIDAGDILQMFGKMFFEFCQESGYDTILRVLGSNVREFLQVSLCFKGFRSEVNPWKFITS